MASQPTEAREGEGRRCGRRLPLIKQIMSRPSGSVSSIAREKEGVFARVANGSSSICTTSGRRVLKHPPSQPCFSNYMKSLGMLPNRALLFVSHHVPCKLQAHWSAAQTRTRNACNPPCGNAMRGRASARNKNGTAEREAGGLSVRRRACNVET